MRNLNLKKIVAFFVVLVVLMVPASVSCFASEGYTGGTFMSAEEFPGTELKVLDRNQKAVLVDAFNAVLKKWGSQSIKTIEDKFSLEDFSFLWKRYVRECKIFRDILKPSAETLSVCKVFEDVAEENSMRLLDYTVLVKPELAVKGYLS